jgi:hypothetical protein
VNLRRDFRVAMALRAFAAAALCATGAGCGSSPNPQATPQAAAKPDAPVIPEDIQAAANALLGSETTVIAFGDLAKNGKQQILAANILPKTPQSTIPGTVVSRAVIAEMKDNNWHELIRCDDYLKNEKGYMGLTPLTRISQWRLQFEQDSEKGLQLYFTPIKGNTDLHVLPIGVRWNPEVKRYQSLDRTYEHFLGESMSLGAARSYFK